MIVIQIGRNLLVIVLQARNSRSEARGSAVDPYTKLSLHLLGRSAARPLNAPFWLSHVRGCCHQFAGPLLRSSSFGHFVDNNNQFECSSST